ncbi:MAG: metal ABC transporter ATP-binding protein [Actinomycetota bacterium]
MLTATGGPLLELSGVHYAYEGAAVLQGVDLAVAPGEFVALVGTNGSGKTTLLKVALGLLRARSGTVRLFGDPVDRFHHWARIGYVPQRMAVARGVPATVREVVASGRAARIGLLRRAKAEDRSAVAKCLAQVGLEETADRPVSELSGGQQQRVLIARALTGGPDLVMLDEPTAGIDQIGQERFVELLRMLNVECGAAVLLVAHDLGPAAPLVTRVVALSGSIIYDGPPVGGTGLPAYLLPEMHGHEHGGHEPGERAGQDRGPSAAGEREGGRP